MKKIMFIGLIFILVASVNAATPAACNDYLPQGLTTLDSDWHCEGTRAFMALNYDDIELDCAGYTIYAEYAFEGGENNNVTIQNCRFILTEPHGSRMAIYGNNWRFLNNYVESHPMGWFPGQSYYEILAIEGWDDPPNSFGINISIINNTFVHYAGVNETVIEIYLESESIDTLIISGNNFTSNGSLGIFRWDQWIQWGGPNNITLPGTVGNYYEYPGWVCNDADYNGFCDSSFVSNQPGNNFADKSLNGTVTDNYPLSEYYWNPYVAPEEPSGGSSTSASHRGDVAYCTDDGCFESQEAALLAISGEPAKTGNPILDLWNWLKGLWKGGDFP